MLNKYRIHTRKIRISSRHDTYLLVRVGHIVEVEVLLWSIGIRKGWQTCVRAWRDVMRALTNMCECACKPQTLSADMRHLLRTFMHNTMRHSHHGVHGTHIMAYMAPNASNMLKTTVDENTSRMSEHVWLPCTEVSTCLHTMPVREASTGWWGVGDGGGSVMVMVMGGGWWWGQGDGDVGGYELFK